MLYPISLPEHYSPAPDLLANKRVIITGAATDLGHAIARSLANHGAELVFIERKERMVTALYDEIVERGGIEPLTVAVVMTKAGPGHLNQLGDSLAGEFESIDGIIHLATSAAPLSPLHLSKPDVWQSFYQTAVLTPLWLTSSLLPLLERATSASVVFANISAGHTGRAYWGPAGAAFAAMRNLCETFAAEQDTTRFNTLAPGRVATAVRHKYYPAEAGSTLRNCDDKLLLKHYLYLLDPQTELTGQHLRVPDKVLP